MNKIILALFCFLLFACANNSTDTSAKDSVSKDSVKTMAGNWSKEDEMEFIDDCVVNAEGRLGKEKAYTYCKCIFSQVKEKYADMDSATIVKLQDTTEIIRLAKNCD